ncbi:Alpha/Beta hydrolase protein [Earliella scabrosa]|nr:Alpha/Beta hydrolase protein [Earliella scabrosa]
MASLPRLGLLSLALLAAAFGGAAASPLSAPIRREPDGSSVTPLTPSQMATFKPYSFFAATAYCPPRFTVNWTCGLTCRGNPKFIPVQVGGDGAFIQFWFVGYDPDLDEVIVSHQGTQLPKIIPLLTDADTLPLPLSPTLFPGVPPLVLVHNGFADEQAATSQVILAAVQKTMAQFGTKKVTAVGHSLGAGISLLEAIFLRLHIPDATVRFVGYGCPRVGDNAFVNWVDQLDIQVNHIANKKDIVTTLPPLLLLGLFRHISGEIHITETEHWMNCPGHDNPSPLCTTGDPNILGIVDLLDHAGPYDGVLMACILDGPMRYDRA